MYLNYKELVHVYATLHCGDQTTVPNTSSKQLEYMCDNYVIHQVASDCVLKKFKWFINQVIKPKVD